MLVESARWNPRGITASGKLKRSCRHWDHFSSYWRDPRNIGNIYIYTYIYKRTIYRLIIRRVYSLFILRISLSRTRPSPFDMNFFNLWVGDMRERERKRQRKEERKRENAEIRMRARTYTLARSHIIPVSHARMLSILCDLYSSCFCVWPNIFFFIIFSYSRTMRCASDIFHFARNIRRPISHAFRDLHLILRKGNSWSN